MGNPAMVRGEPGGCRVAIRRCEWAFWAIGAFVVFLLANGSHAVWDRDEPRYCLATLEMLRYGDWVVPSFNRAIRYDKPVFTYWAMAPWMAMFGYTEFAARFASALSGAIRVAILFPFALMMGCSLAGARLATLAGAAMVLLLALSKAATTDSLLITSVVAAMCLAWMQQVRGFSWGRQVALYAVLGLSVLIKGPIGPMIVLLGLWAFWLWNRFLPSGDAEAGGPPRPARFGWATVPVGLLVFLAVALPWGVAVWLRTEGGFLKEAVGHHVIDRARNPHEGHDGPIFYYVPIFPAVVLPFTVSVLAAIGWAWGNRGRGAVRFLVSWFVPGFIVFSSVSTKLPHYIAPLLPAAALLLGLWWTAVADQPATARMPRWLRRGGAWLLAVLGVGACVGLPVAIRVAGMPVSLVPFVVTGLLLLAVLGGAAVMLWRGADERAHWWAGVGLPVVLLVGVGWALASLQPLRPSKNTALWLRENAPAGTRLIAVDYQEPSLYFYWGDPVTEFGKQQWNQALAVFGAEAKEPWALVTTARRWDDWQQKWAGEHGDRPMPERATVKWRERFYQFEKGRWIEIVVLGNW